VIFWLLANALGLKQKDAAFSAFALFSSLKRWPKAKK